ncbi:MAG: NADP-dependent oxidoreductase [Pseudomonadota bacterium]
MTRTNRQVLFVKRPSGRPTPDVFELATSTVRPLRPGEYLVQNRVIAMDPALVSRMRDEANYAESVAPGDVMHAYAVGEVVESNCAEVPVGQRRCARFGMQEYAIANPSLGGFPVDTDLAPDSWFLGVLGTTGVTAWLSFRDICDPRPGETVLISSAGSSVGTIVAQLALEAGCKVVGIVSTPEKAARVQTDWGYQKVLSYRDRSVAELSLEISAACPDGVDVYYDNTSGDISEAVLDHYNVGARIAVVGRMALSHLADTRLDVGRRDNNVILSRRIRKQGFVLTDHLPRMPEAISALAGMIEAGRLRVEEDVLEGIENAPKAFFRMLNGESRGKQIVRLSGRG